MDISGFNFLQNLNTKNSGSTLKNLAKSFHVTQAGNGSRTGDSENSEVAEENVSQLAKQKLAGLKSRLADHYQINTSTFKTAAKSGITVATVMANSSQPEDLGLAMEDHQDLAQLLEAEEKLSEKAEDGKIRKADIRVAFDEFDLDATFDVTNEDGTSETLSREQAMDRMIANLSLFDSDKEIDLSIEEAISEIESAVGLSKPESLYGSVPLEMTEGLAAAETALQALSLEDSGGLVKKNEIGDVLESVLGVDVLFIVEDDDGLQARTLTDVEDELAAALGTGGVTVEEAMDLLYQHTGIGSEPKLNVEAASTSLAALSSQIDGTEVPLGTTEGSGLTQGTGGLGQVGTTTETAVSPPGETSTESEGTTPSGEAGGTQAESGSVTVSLTDSQEASLMDIQQRLAVKLDDGLVQGSDVKHAVKNALKEEFGDHALFALADGNSITYMKVDALANEIKEAVTDLGGDGVSLDIAMDMIAQGTGFTEEGNATLEAVHDSGISTADLESIESALPSYLNSDGLVDHKSIEQAFSENFHSSDTFMLQQEDGSFTALKASHVGNAFRDAIGDDGVELEVAMEGLFQLTEEASLSQTQPVAESEGTSGSDLTNIMEELKETITTAEEQVNSGSASREDITQIITDLSEIRDELEGYGNATADNIASYVNEAIGGLTDMLAAQGGSDLKAITSASYDIASNPASIGPSTSAYQAERDASEVKQALLRDAQEKISDMGGFKNGALPSLRKSATNMYGKLNAPGSMSLGNNGDVTTAAPGAANASQNKLATQAYLRQAQSS